MGQRFGIFCIVTLLTVLVFGSVFEKTILQVESQLPTTLKITKLTTRGDDTFDFTVTGPTSYNPSITTSASGGAISSNAGTFGHELDGVFMTDTDNEDVYPEQGNEYVTSFTAIPENLVNTEDLGMNFGTAVHFESQDDTVVLGGTGGKADKFGFLTDNSTETWSMSFWLHDGYGFDSANGDLYTIMSSTGEGGGQIFFGLKGDGVSELNPYFWLESSSLGSVVPELYENVAFPEDGQWHLITITVEKPNISDTVSICIDGSSNCDTHDRIQPFDAGGPEGEVSMSRFLKLNDQHFAEGYITEGISGEGFDIDEICIWKDAVLSPSDIDSLYNSGDGANCAEINDIGTTTDTNHLLYFIDPEVTDDSIDVHLDIGNSGKIGSGITLNNQKVTQIRANLDTTGITTGTLTAYIWDNVRGDGSTTFDGDEVVVAQSETWDFAVDGDFVVGNPAMGDFPIFNFSAPTLTGNYVIGFKWEGINEQFTIDMLSDDTDFAVGNSVFIPDDECVYSSGGFWDDCNNLGTSIGVLQGEVLVEEPIKDFEVTTGVQPSDLIGYWTFDIDTLSGGSGMGTDGPTPVEPGTYSIQETIPASWILTTATCSDGSSSFSVDTVSGIEVGLGDNIECTFVNEFTASTPDTDGDGIFDEVDTLPNTVSDDFSDISLGGTSSGTITTRGDQILSIAEEPNPEGVRITADISGGLLPAVVSACGGISIITLSPGDDIVVTCGSATIDVINGPVDITFMGSGGTQATTSLTTGNSITFDQDNFSFIAPSTNVDPVVVIVEGEQVILNPSQAVNVLLSNKDSFIKQGELNTNEGVNTMMRIRDNGNNRALVSFDQNEIQAVAQGKTLLSATLRLYIEENGNNWGSNGRTIDVHRLLADWDEGNGFNDKPASMTLSQFNDLKTRGDGLGVTWKCATDTEINNQQTNCSEAWNGAAFDLTPTDTKTIFKDNPPTHTVKTVGWIEFDVTSDVQEYLTNTEQNYGWVVKKTDEGATGLVEFTSDEASANKPELVLVFD